MHRADVTPGKVGTRVDLELRLPGSRVASLGPENAGLAALRPSRSSATTARLTGMPCSSSGASAAALCSSQLASSSGRVTTTISSASKRASASWIASSGSESPASAATVIPGVSAASRSDARCATS